MDLRAGVDGWAWLGVDLHAGSSGRYLGFGECFDSLDQRGKQVEKGMTKSSSSYQVVMPKLGLTMTEATIIEWRKQDGEWIEKGEPLFVLESEKATLEIEAPNSGVLHILLPAGEKTSVNEPIALLAAPEAATFSEVRASAPPVPPPPLVARPGSPAVPHSMGSHIAPASPKARMLARQQGLNLEGFAGTGVRGMIVAADVVRAAASRPATKTSPVARKLAASAGLELSAVAGTGASGRIMRSDVERALSGPMAPEPIPTGPVPLPGLRGIIAERLSASWRERPHVTLTTEADATQLVNARQQAIAESGEKVSYDAFLVAVVARALHEHPHVNARWSTAGIEQLGEINIGVAVDTERGLLVPVVRDAPSLRLRQIHQRLGELVERILDGRSLPDDLTGGTFTITNLGMFEIDAFTPIINPPESAILGVGRIVARPVALERQVVVRDMMALSLSFDHRVLDGAPAARFLQRVKHLVEWPLSLLF